MEKHIENFIKKISYLSLTLATLTLLLSIFFFQTPPQNCLNQITNHPKTSCDASHRRITTISKKNHRIWSTNTWRKSVRSYTTIFNGLNIISNNTRVLIVSAGGGQPVMALKELGIVDVMGVELVDSPPLVRRADPHNLPFFDRVFDLVFSGHLGQALFPGRYVGEMERSVRIGGMIVVCVEVFGDSEVKNVMTLFRKSEFLEVRNVTLMRSKMTMVVAKRIKNGS
uniref:uncharacterized protein LOC122584939 n=1 Tax=Erigeron canadensis TaxID=72917 RepID=UPI001CB8AB63|nr:uncharacterized protein LOC122584939 [Erigeron canadensis]XP_043612959.1 uncharacterized protein LOC122584939 [Erigeron canadensis]XP_043612960.1 uncharacterized protein LOC122584939 [Erigeron canadensis]XP_043612961.1 uncharacterized protein LOC122584939 [Erigeron canadensis]XP_043612962.1 uncharacterized protein LOC122584939 [Erigeron canadensis]XP_043612963.1 uncharacterized protein LOC122584939 [Erigeron canadensis]XP_043612964.1 uncharacterized protein LOC122584939 [Erigeron canadensi